MVRQTGRTSVDTVHQRYRRLLRAGFSQSEAGALLAQAAGIPRRVDEDAPGDIGWTWQQVAHLQFLRYLVEAGRITG